MPPTEGDVRAALQEVQDPEFPLSVLDMGMVYGVRVDGGTAHIDLTFTSIGCPAMDMIGEDIREAVLAVPGIADVQIEVVWNPPWTRERISERGRHVLTMLGVVN